MQSSSFNHNQQPLQCERKLLSQLSRLQSSLAQWCTSLLIAFVPLDIRAGLVASSKEVFANTRLLSGFGLMVVGVASLLFHYLFDKTVRDYSWLYINWYYYFYTIRVYVFVILWSLGFLFCAPAKYKLLMIPVVIAQGFCWSTIIHISLETNNDQVFEFPHWMLLVIGVSMATSFTICMDELVYMWEHKRKGILCRFVGLTEIDYPQDQKEIRYKQLAKEYRQLNTIK